MTDELLQTIKVVVEEAVDKKINGKLSGIKDQLNAQDKVLKDVQELLNERRFVMQLWTFIKFVGGVAVSVGGAFLLYTKLKP